jgi:ElaA protein
VATVGACRLSEVFGGGHHAATMDPLLDSVTRLQWRCLRYVELARDDLYELLQVRSAVFVVEQACAYLDPDGKDRDPETRHLLGRAPDDSLAAYLRLLPPGLSYDEASFGRVLTAPAWRGRGLGDALVVEALRLAPSLWPGHDLRIGAQAHLAGYYAKHGFTVCSEPYDEDGIPHVEMRRPAAG